MADEAHDVGQRPRANGQIHALLAADLGQHLHDVAFVGDDLLAAHHDGFHVQAAAGQRLFDSPA
jgi:hypothetical protein